MNPILAAEGLVRRYPLPRAGLFAPRRFVQAVEDVSFTLELGETLGIVGESGSGKSTLARLLAALERPEAGIVRFMGAPLSTLAEPALRLLRPNLQMIFQDPFGSLDPRLRIVDSVTEPLRMAEPALGRGGRAARAAAMLERVGLGAGVLDRYPHQFSGGQRQRIAIARALITHPKLVIADEPVSALDVSVQAQILNLIIDLKAEFGLSLIFISHDLGIVQYLADRVIVLKAGRIVEHGPTETLFSAPSHAYTRRLIAARPAL